MNTPPSEGAHSRDPAKSSMLQRLAIIVVVLGACRSHGKEAPASRAEEQRRADANVSISLYARRTAEIHLDSPTGPIVGRVHQGAHLDVNPAEPGWLRISLPAQFASKYSDAKVVTLVTADAFTPARQPLVAVSVPASSRVIKDLPGIPIGATAEKPGDRAPFAATICGEVHVLTPGAPARIAQVFAGVELFGWVEDSDWLRRGLTRCSARTVARSDGKLLRRGGVTEADVEEISSVPENFVGAELSANGDPIAVRIADGRPLYWLVETERAATVCREWRFARLPTKESVLVRSAPITTDGQRVFVSFASSYAKRELTLFGPHFTKRPIDRVPSAPVVGGYKCAVGYTYVGTLDDAVRMTAFGDSLVAWHPDDEERWYLSAAACETARARADLSLAQDHGRTPPGGVHVDCFPELSEK